MSSTNRGTGREGLDRYYTPTALAGALVGLLDVAPGSMVVEPSVGAGAFAQALMHQGCSVLGIDADERAPWLLERGGLCADVLSTDLQADWYVGNPPFRDAERHLRHALSRSRIGCAFLLRLAFLESRKRYQFWSGPPCERGVCAEHPPIIYREWHRLVRLCVFCLAQTSRGAQGSARGATTWLRC
jgi:hypothetical protein